MPLPLFILAASGDTGLILTGIAGLITAVGGILVPIVLWRRKHAEEEPDEDDLYADARRSIEVLRGTVKDLERQIEACRVERDQTLADLKERRLMDQQKDMHIGALEGQLAETRQRIRELEALIAGAS